MASVHVVEGMWVLVSSPRGILKAIRATGHKESKLGGKEIERKVGSAVRIKRIGDLFLHKLVGLELNKNYVLADSEIVPSLGPETIEDLSKHAKRKAVKLSPVFRLVEPTPYDLLSMYHRKMDIRLSHEALAQILFMSACSTHCIVVDGFKGLVASSIAHRRGSTDSLFVHTFDSTVRGDSVLGSVAHVLEVLGLKRSPGLFKANEFSNQISSGENWSLVVATPDYIPPSSFTEALAAAPGFVDFLLYHPMKEGILPLLDTLLKSQDIADLELRECFSREYACTPGCMHPQMNKTGSSGFLLSGTRLLISPFPQS